VEFANVNGSRFSQWTPARRAQLAAALKGKVVELEQDEELREFCDWMIQACGLEPSGETRQLVLLASIVVAA
jgi:hypothetical protein